MIILWFRKFHSSYKFYSKISLLEFENFISKISCFTIITSVFVIRDLSLVATNAPVKTIKADKQQILVSWNRFKTSLIVVERKSIQNQLFGQNLHLRPECWSINVSRNKNEEIRFNLFNKSLFQKRKNVLKSKH